MHIDVNTLDDGTLIEGDLCIVGAGAAGISMALEWVGRGERVLLLEGGGFQLEPETQALNRGQNIGLKYYALEATRLRFFGGTTGHWSGFCTPFDALDLKKRAWVPHSGWPFQKEDLDPFYERAHPLIELGPYEYDVGYWEKLYPDFPRLPLDERKVWTKMWQFSPPTRFGTTYREALVNAPNVHLYTHANVCDIACNEAVTQVKNLTVKTLDGKTHTVQARRYVLACGTLQNARLLLASNNQAPRGLGNEHDLVGRYFMEHPEVRTAVLHVRDAVPMNLYHYNFSRTKVRGELGLPEAQQAEHGLLNCTASLWPGRFKEAPATIDTFPKTAEGTLERLAARERARAEEQTADMYSGSETEYVLATRLEQAPNPASRVLLGDEKDALGMPRLRLDWHLTDLDKYSIRKTYELIGQEMGRAGLGRVQIMDWVYEDDPPWPSTLGGGWHHMGTTRMHENPREGVVDADGKVHGLENLYVAGSATFATAGAANPTLTIIALALRLSDHLKTRAR